jgi:hypothetical protein
MDRGNPLNLDCGQAKNATDVCIGTLLAMVKLVHNIVSVLRSLCGPPSKVTLQQMSLSSILLEMVIQVSSTSILCLYISYNDIHDTHCISYIQYPCVSHAPNS